MNSYEKALNKIRMAQQKNMCCFNVMGLTGPTGPTERLYKSYVIMSVICKEK